MVLFNARNELQDLQNEAKDAFKKYENKTTEIIKEISKHLGRLNGLVGTINSERHSLREEIYSLHDFLKAFRDIGKQLTPFDFEVEPFHGLMGHQAPKSAVRMKHDAKSSNTKWLPIAFELAHEVYKIFKDKDNLKDLTIEFNKKRTEWNKDIIERKHYRDFCKDAADIADIYRMCVTVVRDAIRKQIIPELQAVRCFFFADAMKEAVLYDNDMSDIRLNSVMIYQNTPYHKHYLFVKNTFDFYLIICKFFTVPYLLDILSNETVSAKMKKRFYAGREEVHRQLEMVQENIILAEGN